MNNKKLGNRFERDTAEYLSRNGYWVYRIPDKINGQPFDIIAVKGDKIIAADCKVCSKGYFDKRRIEENQHTAMKKLMEHSPKAKVGFFFKVGNFAMFVSYKDVVSEEKGRVSENTILLKGEMIFEAGNNDCRGDNN